MKKISVARFWRREAAEDSSQAKERACELALVSSS